MKQVLSTFTPTEKVDLLNIGLIIISCALAIVMPFELFLFSYAVLGPLHYLTEISWLHDNKYYTTKRYDAIVLFALGLVLTTLSTITLIAKTNLNEWMGILFYVTFFTPLLFLLVKNNLYRAIGLVLILLTSSLGNKYFLFFVIMLPTLIHVFLFTGFFMLYGTIKSKSRTGPAAIAVFLLATVFLFYIYTTTGAYQVSDYARENYSLFKVININWLYSITGVGEDRSAVNWDHEIFQSVNGIILMRFIAFAYTYHYLNWFSKTNIIKWNNVSKPRMIAIIIIWILSVVLYWVNYKLGLTWLLLLSYQHVLLELPLNFRSMLLMVGYKPGK